MICLGVDPDTFNTGVALVENSRVIFATTVASDPKRGVDWRIVRQILGGRGEFYRLAEQLCVEVDRIAVETMRHYTGKTTVRPQDLLHLNLVAGAMLGGAVAAWPDAAVWAPKPQEWKGTVSKAVHQKRVLKQVGLTPALRGVPGTDTLTEVQKGHIVDAIGLALKVSTHHFLPSILP